MLTRLPTLVKLAATARRVSALLAAALLLVTGCLTWVSCARSTRKPDILLITIDTLRPDHMSLYGYERKTTRNLDQWFAGGLRFETSYSTDANTPPSVVSILTGYYPQDHGVRLFYQLLPESNTLITDLLPEEYQTAAVVSNIVLTEEAMGLSKYFDHYDDFVDEKEAYRYIYERSAERTTDAALVWLLEERDTDRPLFLWVHYIDPHGPYHPPSDWTFSFTHEGTASIDSATIRPYQVEPGVTDGLVYVDRYDEEIAYMDSEVGRLLDGYAKTADVDDAFIIFTSDHGESMMEHEVWFTHGYQVYEEIIRVPLMIRGPGVPQGVRKEPVSGIDLFPTILGLVNVAPPSYLPGMDLLQPEMIDMNRILFAEAAHSKWQVRGVFQSGRKWIARVPKGTRDVTGVRYYDLSKDPLELDPDIWPDDETYALDLLLELIDTDPDPGGEPIAMKQGIRLGAPKVAPRADAEALEKLRSLGYVK